MVSKAESSVRPFPGVFASTRSSSLLATSAAYPTNRARANPAAQSSAGWLDELRLRQAVYQNEACALIPQEVVVVATVVAEEVVEWWWLYPGVAAAVWWT
jgi:hypothetical protein